MEASDTTSTILFTLALIIGFCVAFALIWIFVVWLISLMAGWSNLARRYPATMPRPEVLGGQTMKVGSARYGHAMEIATNSLGLWLQPSWAFRVGHKPIFIPWTELSNPRFMMVRRENLVKLDVGVPPQQTIALPGEVLKNEPAATRLVIV